MMRYAAYCGIAKSDDTNLIADYSDFGQTDSAAPDP